MILLPGITLFLKILSFLVASWLLVHVLALFGVFIAVAYPVWWLLTPKQIPCLSCRVKKEGERCPLCRQKVRKKGGLNPKSLSSAFLNASLILIFSLIAFGLVFTESKILFNLGFPPTPRTVAFTIPPKSQCRLEEICLMKIEIAGIKKAINAVQADIGFDSRRIEMVGISTKDSFANIFIQKEINNEVGYARLTGGLPSPGFFADRGTFGTVLFQGKSPGLAQIEFLPSSMVLANDGRGTNVLKQLASTSYLILPEEISKEEKEEQEVLIQPEVLGEEIEETQMKFYEEAEVLGASFKEEVEEGKKSNLVRTFLDLLERTDRFILSSWGRLFTPGGEERR